MSEPVVVGYEEIKPYPFETDHPVLEAVRTNPGMRAVRVRIEHEGNMAIMLTAIDARILEDAIDLEDVFLSEFRMWVVDNPPPEKL